MTVWRCGDHLDRGLDATLYDGFDESVGRADGCVVVYGRPGFGQLVDLIRDGVDDVLYVDHGDVVPGDGLFGDGQIPGPVVHLDPDSVQVRLDSLGYGGQAQDVYTGARG